VASDRTFEGKEPVAGDTGTARKGGFREEAAASTTDDAYAGQGEVRDMVAENGEFDMLAF
jgi:hypothetical protein